MRFEKKDIKKVDINGEIITIKIERDIQIDKQKILLGWKLLKRKEEYLKKEKERIIEIAKKANIKLE